MIMRIRLIHGPNLNLLGKRNPAIYGTMTLQELEQAVVEYGASKGAEIHPFQSNDEGELVQAIHDCASDCHAIVINPGGFSHTSVAIRDALEAVELPVYEVHLSNIHARESFRHKSITAEASTACISGMGVQGYCSALDGILPT